MQWSQLLCLGSTLSALIGLLVLGWGARRERWRWLWILVAAVFLIGAGFGAAETVYQLAVERQERQRLEGTSVSARPAESTPELLHLATATVPLPATETPPPTDTLTPFPTRTLRPTPEPRPTDTALPSPTRTLRPTPEPRPTDTVLPSPTRTRRPTPEARPTATLSSSPLLRPTSASMAVGDLGALAPSLITAERAVLATLDDPPRYVLDVVVDFETLTVVGTAGILYTNNERETLDAVYLRLYPNAEHYEEGETQIDAVNVDGTAVVPSFGDADHTVLEVPLPVPLPPDARTTIQIAFSVTVPRRSDRFGYDEGVMSLGHWYPMLAVYDDEGWNLDPYVALGDAFYSDVAFYTVHLTVPEETVVAATGVEVGQILHRQPRATITYVSGATRDFALALSREYETASTQVGETLVTSYYLPDHERAGREALQVAVDALKVYNARFGLYPFTELDVAETSFTVAGVPGGMEFPGIVFIGSDLYQPGGMFASDLDVVVAHEVAHQWWYGVVGNNQVDEPWLDEAFATFSSIVYVEDQQGTQAAEDALWSGAVLPYQLVQMLGGDGPVGGSLLDYDDNLIVYQTLVYGKGALFLAQLRELLGDEDFFGLLRQHYQAHKYGLLAADDFRRSIEAATGNTDALALYDAVVVRGEALEGLEGLERP
jgi:hypothetical protein